MPEPMMVEVDRSSESETAFPLVYVVWYKMPRKKRTFRVYSTWKQALAWADFARDAGYGTVEVQCKILEI